MSMEKLIFHIDVNSAFLSWEAVERLKHPEQFPEMTVDLRTIPSAVGGDRSKRRGIILAKSIPAKKYKVQTGEPITDALKKCPNLVIVPARHGIYTQYSKAFIAILERYSDAIEQCSIDECFVDMTGTEKLFGAPVEAATRIKDEIYPLVEWGITEAQALKICYDRGFDWNGLYEIYHRCSCWCCPFQRIGELKNLRCYHPELWARLRELDKRALDQFGHSALGRFKDNWNVEQLEHRFAAEDAARKEAEMEQDKSKEIRDMFKGVPPKNVIIAVDDLPPKTLEQHIQERKAREQKPKKRGKSR
jgi:hypothetical protein